MNSQITQPLLPDIPCSRDLGLQGESAIREPVPGGHNQLDSGMLIEIGTRLQTVRKNKISGFVAKWTVATRSKLGQFNYASLLGPASQEQFELENSVDFSRIQSGLERYFSKTQNWSEAQIKSEIERVLKILEKRLGGILADAPNYVEMNTIFNLKTLYPIQQATLLANPNLVQSVLRERAQNTDGLFSVSQTLEIPVREAA